MCEQEQLYYQVINTDWIADSNNNLFTNLILNSISDNQVQYFFERIVSGIIQLYNY